MPSHWFSYPVTLLSFHGLNMCAAILWSSVSDHSSAVQDQRQSDYGV